MSRAFFGPYFLRAAIWGAFSLQRVPRCFDKHSFPKTHLPQLVLKPSSK